MSVGRFPRIAGKPSNAPWLVALAAVACSGCAAASAARYPIAPTTASNRAAAIADAAKLLSYVVPPSGAVLKSSGSSARPNRHGFVGELASATAWRTWTVSDYASALPFVKAHLPAGGKLFATGSGGPTPSQSAMYRWPSLPGVLGNRDLEIDVTLVTSGGASLYAAAQSQWIETRAASERVPDEVKEVVVSEGWPGKPPKLDRTVTRPGTVRALETLIDSLPIVQPVGIACPFFKASQTITVSFDGARGADLARASVSAQANLPAVADLVGSECLPTEFSVDGRSRAPLAGNVIRPLERILHVHFRG
jgi:hypothetical protein